MIAAEYTCWKDIILASCVQTLRSMNYVYFSVGEITRAAVSGFIGESDWHSFMFSCLTAFLTRLMNQF